MSSSTIDRVRRWILVGSLALAAVLTAPTAHAEPEAFRSSYAAGKNALQSGSFREALDHFRQSLRDAGEHQAASWKGLMGAAYAFRYLEEPGYALEYYRRFLAASATHESMLPPKWRAKREAVQAEVSELENLALETHALLSVTSSPQGAAISINGLAVGADGTALTPYPLYLKPGKHTLTLTLAGHEDEIRTMELSAGELVPMTVTLKAVTIEAPTPPVTPPTVEKPVTTPEVSPPTPVVAVAPTHPQGGADSLTATMTVTEAVDLTVPYTLIGVGAAAALTAVGLTVGASMKNTELEDEQRYYGGLDAQGQLALTGSEARYAVQQITDLTESRDTMQTASNVFYGIGVTVAVSGVIWMLVVEDDGAATSAPVVGFTPTTGGATTSATWRF